VAATRELTGKIVVDVAGRHFLVI